MGATRGVPVAAATVEDSTRRLLPSGARFGFECEILCLDSRVTRAMTKRDP